MKWVGSTFKQRLDLLLLIRGSFSFQGRIPRTQTTRIPSLHYFGKYGLRSVWHK